MSICAVTKRAGWAALLLLTTSPLAVARAGDSSVKPPASLSQPASTAAVDAAPTGAIGPRAVSRLDLSPPPGLLPELPPEAQPPSFANPPVTYVVAPAAPAKDATATVEAPAAPQPSPSPTGEPPQAPAAPAAQAEITPAPPAQAAPVDTLADDIHTGLDRFVAATQAGRPIGAGDWGAARKAIAAFYAARNYAPLWTDGDHLNAAAKSALARLAKAGEDGLDLADLARPAADWSDRDPGAQAEAEIEISAAVVAYAMQATGARIKPEALSNDVSAKPEVADPGLVLKSVAAADDPDAALAAFNPPQAGYRALRAALARMRDEGPAPAARLSPGPVLLLGMSDPRVPLIRARLGLSSRKDDASPEVYDVRVASAVAAFQRVHGLRVNGALTRATANALGGGDNFRGRREALVLANMEMWRWEPRQMGEMRVEVNVPDFSLKLMNGDTVLRRARVIVGKPDTPTPIFSDAIRYMLFNPAWHVPESIVKKEMEPKYAADRSYFARHGYKVTYVGHRLVVVQPPGEANALGRMLFLFPNAHAVYLHDTPQRSLFSASYRAFSHGCVRVDDPARLAEIVMGGAKRGWTDARVRSLLGDKERTFSLPTPVPVHLEYFTEFVDENGVLRERGDLYGLTRKVVLALAKLRRD